jgi:error-prone DNA polymerase
MRSPFSLPPYAELHCRSNFSFLGGASRPEELIDRAQQLGYAALAITDECSLGGVVRAHAHLKTYPEDKRFHLIVGAEMRLTTPRDKPRSKKEMADERRRVEEAAAFGKDDEDGEDVAENNEKAKDNEGIGNFAHEVEPAGTTSGRYATSLVDRVATATPADTDPDENDPPEEDIPSPPGGQRLVLLAQTRRGYGNLSHWVTVARRRAPKGTYLAHASDVEGKVPDAPTLAGLPDCLALLVPDASQPFEVVFAHAMWLKTWFQKRAFIALELLHRPNDDVLLNTVRRVARLTGLPIVAAGGVLMHVRSRKPLQDVLTATKLNLPVSQCGWHLEGNAEAHLRSRGRLASLYEAQWLENTLLLAAQCKFSLGELKYEYPREIVPEGQTPISYLRQLAYAGAEGRFGRSLKSEIDAVAARVGNGCSTLAEAAKENAKAKANATEVRARQEQGDPAKAAGARASMPDADTDKTAEQEPPADAAKPKASPITDADLVLQIEHELALIQQLEYEPYFLTVADIVRWARSKKILCQGRGSAANSLVCYCLGVTEVNPRDATLLFERFVSAERKEPPDIDIDFEHQRREDVIQYIYGKYGRHRAALTAVVISYRPRSAVRDVGRALGIDLQRIDGVAKGQQWWDGRGINPERLRENGFDPDAPIVRLWAELTEQLIGFPRHLSQHPGGFVIARDQIEQLVPVENTAMPNRLVVQWDKDDLDTLGLIKVDILALGMLSALRRSFEFVGAKLGRDFKMPDVPLEDPATYDMICQADTIGVFQIESRAQMSMLPRLKPRTYYDLVVEVAIVRPGPIQGGMVHPFLNSRDPSALQVECPEALWPALKRTGGVPIFQEQVMQIAMIAADFTGGEADQLRRAMAAWKRKGGLQPFHDKLVGRMVAKGYDLEYAERIFKQIQGFGEYGFPESHAAGFALLAYVSSWVKRHHPDAFLAGLLNSQPMGFYQPAQLVRDAREHGVQVLPVDVRFSRWESGLEMRGTEFPSIHAEPFPFRLEVSKGPRCEPPSVRPEPVEGFGGLAPRLRQAQPERQELHPVRLGLNRIQSLPDAAAKRIVKAREERPFDSLEDLVRRAFLNAHELDALARADALQGLSGHRHQAAWAVAGIDTRPTAMLRDTRVHEAPVVLQAPQAAEDTLADYGSVGLSLKHHPLALLRDTLAGFKVQPSAVLRTYPHGRLARASGLVTHRQRPETAKGTIFVTLEDETGAVNVVVWSRVAEAQRRPLLAAKLLTVFGLWQRVGEGDHAVMHLVATKLIDHSELLNGLVARSRDFH